MSRPLVVLDIDDTLYLERDYVRSGFQAVDAHLRDSLGVDGFFESAWTLFLDGQRGDIFDRALAVLPKLAGANIDVRDLVSIYRCHTPAISLLPDAEQFIHAVAEVADLAVVSDGPAESQRAKAAKLGLLELGDALVLTSEHGTGWAKPSSESFRYLQARFSSYPDASIYYADNPLKDFIGPGRLGWHTVRVRRPDGLHTGVDSDGGSERAIHGFSDAEIDWLLDLPLPAASDAR